ncbi:MAG: GntR family transcriptional regulator [Anaeroplasmataceae bacterium]|nr:GntR family transcriptional regulator [Anaeroplasmataceae bacterium]MDE5867868.1 GntR family transcriptional regulator [Anaeroplasmataceae bacterium]
MEWKNDRAIFLQVIDLFKKDIIRGVYGPGEKIMSVREYGLKLNINPNTVVKVYDVLTNEGLIVAKSTSGYFLTSDQKILDALKPEFAKQYKMEFLEQMSDLGYSKEESIQFLKEE